ncbi:hypothetical protein ABZ357_39765 [Streptomyces sp. NPDC005917]|uniref:hypothetical protein n=1 Tax=unclassified Streptomyces TaxID=2593676 RepID=UPI0033F74F84
MLGNLVLGEKTREVRRSGTPISLTAKAFDLLRRDPGGRDPAHPDGHRRGVRRTGQGRRGQGAHG